MIRKLGSFMRSDGLGARAFRGSVLSFLGFGTAMVLRLASNLILTRILFPDAFGLMALATVVLTALTMFSDTGTAAAILQNKRGDEPAFQNTAWTIEIVRGLLLWAIVATAAPFIAGVFGQPDLTVMLQVAGATALLNGFTSTKAYIAHRHLVLGRLTFLELGSQLTGILVTIILALALQSVWALVLGGLAGTLAKTVFSHIVFPGPGNRLHWDRDIFFELFHFGKYIFIGSIAGFLINSGDRAILGKFVSLSDLAVYSIAFFLATVPLMLSQHLSGRVLLPLYARLRSKDAPDERAKLLKSRALLTGVLLLMAVTAGLVGEWLVQLLYTKPYHLAGPILVLLSITFMPSIATQPYQSLLLGRGNSRDLTLLQVVTATLQTTALYIGVSKLGLIGAVLAPPVAMVAVYPLTAWLAHREGGWEPAVDAVCLAAILLGTGIVLWLNDSAIARVMAAAS